MTAQRSSAMANARDNPDYDDERSDSEELACVQWARDLQTLLNDDKGCDLFESYLEEEQCDLSELNFIYACTGLRIEAEPSLRDKRARIIYRHYVKNGVINSISDKVKIAIKERLDGRRETSDDVCDIFDDALCEVRNHVTRTTFARFIQSDLYLSYVQDEEVKSRQKSKQDTYEEGDDVSHSSAPAPSDSDEELERMDGTNLNQLVPLSEHEELTHGPMGFVQPPPPPATTMVRKYAKTHYEVPLPPPPLPSRTLQLQKRQSQRGLMFAETIKQHGHRPPLPNPYHVMSSSFVPPSAYNSEIQSMSSGGGNYAELDLLQRDMDSHEFSRRHSHEERSRMQRSAFRKYPNSVRTNLQQSVIPRTMFVFDPNNNLARDNPERFHQIIYEKLLKVERDSVDRFGKMAIEDESQNQSILDKHCDRVFKTPPVRTPRSPPEIAASPLGMATVPRKTGHKSPYHSGFTRIVHPRKDDNDSAIYLCSSGASTSTGVPLVQPRRRMAGLPADSGCEESLHNAPIYSLNENVREWVNRPGHETTKSKNKSSVHSGSNRSSKNGQDEKKSKSSSISLSREGVVVGYQYESEDVPFVIRLPFKQPRLKDFKSQLTKKGNYRYFFKHLTDAFGSDYVFEEVTDDGEVLPMCDGKIFARITGAPDKE